MKTLLSIAAILAASSAHSQTSVWNFTGSASGNLVIENADYTSTTTPTSMDFSASFTVTNGTMTAYSVNGISGTGSAGYFGPGGEISPLYNAQGQVYGGEVFYSMSAPTGGGIAFNINDGAISYLSEFGESDGTTTYESLAGSGGWIDPPTAAPEIDWSRAIVALTLLAGAALVLKATRRTG